VTMRTDGGVAPAVAVVKHEPGGCSRMDRNGN
jgi:hypothetical protein